MTGSEGRKSPFLPYEEKFALLEERGGGVLNEPAAAVAGCSTRLCELASKSPFSRDKFGRMPDASTLARGVIRASLSMPWRLLALRTLIFLIPSFLQPLVTGEKPARQDRLMPTAYLDGMRGLAALFVYFCHYTYQLFTIAEGWGSSEKNYDLLKLPFLRLWFQGPPMVCVFFVISGYALSLKALKQMRAGAWDGLAGTLSSMTFRRGIRLFMPTTISTLMVVFLLRIGAYELTRDFANDRNYMKNVVETHPLRLPTLSEQLAEWAHQMYLFVRVFNWDLYAGKISTNCPILLFIYLLLTDCLRPQSLTSISGPSRSNFVAPCTFSSF
jgi:hypothetical protein